MIKELTIFQERRKLYKRQNKASKTGETIHRAVKTKQTYT